MSKYQVFISYRYVDEDGFVADELHKALIDFKVPLSLRKNLNNPNVYKIDKIFQDKINLSVAESLWDTIEEALSETEYLVVICSPRVDKDTWCYKEIETFINKNGADRVIAVLAEGEPTEVIPNIMHVNGKLPFAADVRGASEREIKKRIKEAIPRIVAPIFGLEHERLHNKFQEEKWKKRLKLMMGVSAIVVASAVFSTEQMLEARHQKSIQEKQLVRIENQMRENLFQQEKILTLLAEKDMNDGNMDAAIENLLKGLPDDIDTPEYPIYNQACYDLSKALMVYENGGSYSSTKKPFTDFETGELIAASKIKQIDENRMLLVCDSMGTGYIWNVREGKADFKFLLSYYNDEAYDDGKNNYFFDNSGDKNIAIADNVLYISDGICIRAIALDSYQILWELNMDYTMALDVYDDIVVACNIGDVRVIHAKTGEVIASRSDFDDEFGNQLFKHAFLSKDKKSVIIRAEYDTELEYDHMNSLDSENEGDMDNDFVNGMEDEFDSSQIKAYLYRVRVDDLTLIEKEQIGGFGSESYWLDPNRELLYVFEYMRCSENADVQSSESSYARICAYELKDLSERWSLSSEDTIRQAYFFDDSVVKDKVFFVDSNTILEVSKEDGDTVYSGALSSDIINLEFNESPYMSEEGAEYCLEALCTNGSVFVQTYSHLGFSPRDIYEFGETEGIFYRFGNRFVIPYMNSSFYYDNQKLESPYGTYIPYDKIPVIDSTMVQSNSFANFEEERFGVRLVPKENSTVDIWKAGKLIGTYAYENDTITEAIVTPDARFVFFMFGQSDTVMINIEKNNITYNDIIMIGNVDIKMIFMTKNPNEWIVSSGKYGENEFAVYTYDENSKTFEKYLFLKEFTTYDAQENMIYECCDNKYMKVPLYSIKELVELARNTSR